MSPSPLETAILRMRAAPDDAAARLQFHAELADTELFLWLEAEAEGGSLRPQVFDLSEGRAVLAFDSELRLAGFAGTAAPYAALPGRVLVTMLAGMPPEGAAGSTGVALLLNGDSDHAELLPAEALRWLAATLAGATPSEAEEFPERFEPVALGPHVLALLTPALERRLRGMPGLERAVLAAVVWRGGGRGHVLALEGLPEVARAPLARAVAEALELSGVEAGALDVIFPEKAAMAPIAAVGLALAPAAYVPPAEPRVAPMAPGMDPNRPPRLK